MIRSSVSEMALNGIGPSKYAPPVRKRSLPRNQFRGIKKEELQRQTSMYLASMTVSLQCLLKNNLFKKSSSTTLFLQCLDLCIFQNCRRYVLLYC